VALATFVGLVLPATSARAELVNFEEPFVTGTPPVLGEAVSEQYLREGVKFTVSTDPVTAPVEFSPYGSGLPRLYRDPSLIPERFEREDEDGQMLYALFCGGEGCSLGTYSAEIFGRLTTETRHVSLLAGTEGGAAAVLAGYNLRGELVAEDKAAIKKEVETQLQISTSEPEIAYFSLARSPNDAPALEMALLEFEIPAKPPPPALVLLQGGGVYGSPGTTARDTVEVERVNGADEPIELHVERLPTGVTLTGGQTIAKGSDSTTLTFSIAPGAPVVNGAQFSISATSSDVAEPPNPIVEDFTITPVLELQLQKLGAGDSASQTETLTGCTSARLPVLVIPGAGVTTPTSLSLSATGDTEGLSDTLQPPSGAPPATLVVEQGPTGPTGEAKITVTGTNGSNHSSATLAVHRQPPQLSNVTSFFGIDFVETPVDLRGSTELQIEGEGFCPGSQVQFGNEKAIASSSNGLLLSSGPGAIIAKAPTLATTGPVTISVPGGGPLGTVTSKQTVTVNSFRNTDAHPFKNFDSEIFWTEFKEAFGDEQTEITIDLCWPFGCDIHVPEPQAYAVWLFGAKKLGYGGLCFGLALSSQRLVDGLEPLALYPPGGPNVYSLPKSEPLEIDIRVMHAEQIGLQNIGDYLEQIGKLNSLSTEGAVTHVNDEIATALKEGEHPLLELLGSIHGEVEGHVVVAYNIEGVAKNEYYIDVYDPNLPFKPGENATNGDEHESNFDSSRILVKANGSWSLPSTGISGNLKQNIEYSSFLGHIDVPQAIVVVGARELPVPEEIPNLANLVSFVFFNNAGAGEEERPGPPTSHITQITNAAGQQLFGPGGQLNTNPSKGLVGLPYLTEQAGASNGPAMLALKGHQSDLRLSIAGTGSGPDTYSLVGGRSVAEIGTTASKGSHDELTLDPGANTLGFSTDAARAPVTMTLLDGPGEVRHTTQVRTTSFRGGSDTLVDSANGPLLKHRGPATTFTFSVTSVQPDGPPATFESGPLDIGANQSASVTDVDWDALAAGTVRVTIGRHTITLHNHMQPPRLATIRRLRAEPVKPRERATTAVSLTVSGLLRRPPAREETTAAILWTVSRVGGHKVVARHTMPVSARPGPVTAAWKFDAPRAGHYTLAASIDVVSTNGINASTSVTSRSLAFSAR
jgi:hypothetical protein